jgi:hypothetical protein
MLPSGITGDTLKEITIPLLQLQDVSFQRLLFK